MKLIDYYDGREENVEIEEIGPAGAGYNAPMKVRVNGVLGYKKKSVNCSTFDSFEYLISQLGKMLNIKVADTYFFDDGSIFSRSIYDEGEEFITGGDILKYVTISEDEIKEIGEERKQFNETLELVRVKDQDKRIAKTPEEIGYVVNQYIDVINRLKVDNRDEIVRDYIRMCFLDVLTGNKDRVSGNYGLIKSGDDYSFAPSFDSSTIGYPGIDDNYVQLNGYLIDRKDLYNYLVSNHYDCLSDIFDKDREKVIDVMKSLLDKVFPNEEDKDNREWFNQMIIGQLDYYLNGVNTLFNENDKTQEEKVIEDAKK